MASKAEKLGDFGEEEQELDLEEDNFKPRITDLLENNHYFKEVIKFLFIYFCLFMLRERNVVHTALSSPEGKRSRRRPPLTWLTSIYRALQPLIEWLGTVRQREPTPPKVGKC